MALNSRSAALSAKARVAPQIDADDTPDHGGPEDPDVIGGLFYLEYRDGKGQESCRDIVLRRVIWRAEKLQVAAHCLLRDQYRCFIVSNFITFANGRTGEVIANPHQFLEGLAPIGTEPPPGPARRRDDAGFAQPKKLNVAAMRKELRDLVRPAGILLMAMAKADERLTKEEVGVIADLVWQGARTTHAITQTEMLTAMVEEVCALQPTPNLITRAQHHAGPRCLSRGSAILAVPDGPSGRCYRPGGAHGLSCDPHHPSAVGRGTGGQNMSPARRTG